MIEVGPLASGERREIEARAVEGSILCGTVRRAETGAPIEHAWVRYEGAAYPRTGSGLQSAYTDAEGRFATRTALVPGPLTVGVSAMSGGKRAGIRHEVVVGQEPWWEPGTRHGYHAVTFSCRDPVDLPAELDTFGDAVYGDHAFCSVIKGGGDGGCGAKDIDDHHNGVIYIIQMQ